MNILFEYCKGCGKHPNEDTFGSVDNIFWIIDGATDVFKNGFFAPNNGDVQWVVGELDQELKKSDSSLPLKDILKNAVTSVRKKAILIQPSIAKMDDGLLPTYAICLARITTNSLEYLCLGDCSIFTSDNPNERFTDSRIRPFHLRINAVKEKYKDNPSLYKQKVKEEVQYIKRFINVEEGYWIGTLNPEIADNAITGVQPVSPRCKIIMCSDGFRPSIDESKLVPFEPEDLFDLEALKNVVNEQQIAEQKYYLQTGIDISDDETILLIET